MSRQPFDDGAKPTSLMCLLFRRGDRSRGGELRCNPVVGWSDSFAQHDPRLPLQHRAQPRIVTVATAYALRFGEVVRQRDLLPGCFDYDFGELVDTDQFVGAEIERLFVIGPHDAMNALDAVIDIHERTGLLAVAPYLDLAGIRSVCDFAAHPRRRLFTATVIGAERTIDVVETNHAGREAIIFHEILAEFLRIELLEAIAFLRLCRECVLLAQR